MYRRWSTVMPGISGLFAAGLLATSLLATGLAVSFSSPAAGSISSARSNGCGASSASGSRTLSIDINGRERTVIVHLPTGYSGKDALPLVLNLHGSGTTASDQELFSGMDATADSDHFIVAYPQGAIVSGSGFDWNVPEEPLLGGSPVPKGSPNDVSFLVKLVSQLGQRYCVNAKRVYATGFSGGARLTSQLGCDAGSVFAAIAPVSGLRLPAGCSSLRAVPVISFHGEQDPIDPYNGNGQKCWTYSVPAAAARWAAHDGCAGKARISSLASGLSLTSYADCRGGARVELYSLASEGHEWPGGISLPAALTQVLGPQSNAIDANEAMWKFFSSYSL